MDHIAVLLDDPEHAWVVESLAALPAQVLVAESWTEFVALARNADAAVSVIPVLDVDLSLAAIADFGDDGVSCPLVIVTRADPDNLASLAKVFVGGVSFLPTAAAKIGRSGQQLRTVLKKMLLAESRLDRLGRETARSSRIRPKLARALRYILSQTPARRPVERGEPGAPVHSVEDLARRIGTNSRLLRRLANEAGLDLHALIMHTLAMQAIALRVATGIPWEQVAWRMGYTGKTGLAMLIRRTTGQGLRTAGVHEVQRLERAVHEALAPIVPNPSEAGEPDRFQQMGGHGDPPPPDQER